MRGNFGFVLAPKALVNNKHKIKYMYRERTTNEKDSGWRFFSGDEAQDYVNNPENIGIYDVNTIIAIDRDIEPLLDSEYGVFFERESEEEQFKKGNLVDKREI